LLPVVVEPAVVPDPAVAVLVDSALVLALA